VKYKVEKSNINNASIKALYSLTDENGVESSWVEWSYGSPRTRHVEYIAGEKWIWTDINVPMTLNIDDPQQSIDRIRKLVVLK
jgi:accessory colonization factor AcfC